MSWTNLKWEWTKWAGCFYCDCCDYQMIMIMDIGPEKIYRGKQKLHFAISVFNI